MVSCAALLGSRGRKNVIAHIKSSVPPLHTQGFFITTSGQNPLCFPNILTTGSSSSTLTFHTALSHLLYQYQVKKGLSHLELPVLLSLLGKFTLKAVPPTVDLVWPCLACASYRIAEKCTQKSIGDSFSEENGSCLHLLYKNSSPDMQICPDLIWDVFLSL